MEEQLKEALEETAINMFKMFECRDYARVDFRVDRDEKVYVIEVNPNPDISPQSGMTRALKAHGMTYTEFIRGILGKALERKN